MRFIKKIFPYQIIRIFSGNITFFDDNGIAHVQKKEIRPPWQYPKIAPRKGEPVYAFIDTYWAEEYLNTDIIVFKSATTMLKEGHTLEEFDDMIALKHERINHSRHGGGTYSYEWYDDEQVIINISKPTFERAPGNKDKKTFDFIRVEVLLRIMPYNKQKQYVQKNFKKLTKIVLEDLEKRREFTRYDVPVNFLKTTATLTRRNTLEFLFELKSIR